MKKIFFLLLTILLISGCAVQKVGEDSEGNPATSTATSTDNQNNSSDSKEVNKLSEEAQDNNKVSINLEESSLAWNGKKFTGKEHNGTIKISKGILQLEDRKSIVGGEFIIDMSTIKDDGGSQNLEKHLSGEDFFDTAKYPEAKLNIVHIYPNGEIKDKTKYSITADLTIKDITRDIVFPATIKFENNNLEISANFAIDRTRWEIKYGSGKFFKGLGDNVIDDEMNYKIILKATIPEIQEANKNTDDINKDIKGEE
ncbi:YceI family protein [Patescibacteria group bacterium]|nr:YceI family protein [Patescibacteria group bacterium]